MDHDFFEPEQRWGHRAVYLKDHVYLYGGCTPSFRKTHDGEIKVKAMSQIFLFDPLTCEWNLKMSSGSPPLGIRDFAVVSHGNDRLIHFGGYCGHDYCWHNSLHTLHVDCDTLHWEELKPNVSGHDCPLKKQDCGMICYQDINSSSILCVFGGAGCINNNHWIATNELHLMNLTEGKWSNPTVTGHSPPCCHGFSFVKINNNKVILFGGRIGKDPNGPLSNQLYLLSLDNLMWEQVIVSGPELPCCREGHSSLVLSDTQLFVIGGLNKHDEAINDIWTFNTETYTWNQINQRIPLFVKQRACHTINSCGYDDNGYSMIIFGGIKRFVRGELHNQQPMMSHTVIIKLGGCNDDNISCFDLTYMGSQAMRLTREYNSINTEREMEIRRLKQQLQDALSQVDKLEKSELEKKQKIRQLTSQSSLDPVVNRAEPIPLSVSQRSTSLPTGSLGTKRSDSLTEAVLDTRTVLEAIDELTDWYTLGLSLGLHTSTLDTIKEECSNVIIRCKAKVIENWLKCMDNVTEQPSWISLVNAISGKLIKDYTLAEKIRNMQVPSLTVKTD